MIIGIDGNEANQEKKVGIGEYAFELLTQFSVQCQMLNVKCQIYLKEVPRPEMPKERDGWKYIVVWPRNLWTQFGLPLYLFTHFPRPNVFFTPTHYAPRFSPIPTAISVMDLSFIHFPNLFAKKDLYQLVNWTKYSVKNASRVFTISAASKGDIINEYGISPEKVVVTYPGMKEISNSKFQIANMNQLQEKYGILGDYILFVGTLQPRKNISRLIEAFSRLKGKGKREKDLQLVIVGKKGWLYEEILDAPKKYGVEDCVLFLDFVPDEELPLLYKHALCYILPSLYEGFGLPVVEAMEYGTPVITSNVSSLPEAGGEAALYVDPLNVEDIAQKIRKVVDNPKLRQEMIQKGYKHIKKFSWETAAKQTLQVLQEVAKGE